jgi:hypothetical protein
MRAWRALIAAGAGALVLAACGGGAASPAGGTQAAGEHWQVVRPASQAWQAVAESDGTFVAVGAPGGIAQSTDGLNWTHHDTPRGFGWGNVVHGDAGWLTLSWDGHVASSPDGVDWTLQSQALVAPSGEAVTTGLAFGNGVFVVVGPTGNFSSANGSDWSSASGAFSFVRFGNGVFVAGMSSFDGSGNDPLYVSADGRTWAAAAGTEGFCVGALAFGNGRFLALDVNGQTRTSPDGTHWTLQPPSFQMRVPSQVGFAAGSFYAFLPGLYASTDGASWAPVPAPPGIDDIYWIGGIAGNANGLAGISASGALYGGSDAQHLVQRVAPSGGNFVAVDHRDGLFVALSNGIDPVALTSTDGRSWNASPMFPHPWDDKTEPQALAHSPDGTFVATGWGDDPVIPSGGHVGAAWSADGVTWTEVGAFYESGGAWGKGIVHDGTRFVLVDEFGRVAASPTGRDGWTALGTVPLQRGQSVEGMAFGGGRYVVVGTLGLAAASQDGVRWTVAPPLGQTAEVAMHAIAWDGRKFVAAGASGLVATSADGLAWQVAPSATPTELWGIAISATGECVAVGWYGVAESSGDCAHWTVRTPAAWEPLFGVASFDGGFVAVGMDGQVELSQ